MLTTRETAIHLASAAKRFSFLGISTPEQLLEVVGWELGHPDILDQPQRYGNNWARAIGPKTILHIISGNTPHAGLQSLIRGLLLNSLNRCKIPSSGLPEIARFKEALPEELANQVEISNELLPGWVETADAVIIFGSDQTIAHFHSLVRLDQIFLGHGHKISFGIVFEDPKFESVQAAARDFSLFDQQGCLSPHLVYVKENPMAYAERLASAMDVFNHLHPRTPLEPEQSAQIHEVRQNYQFRAALEPGVKIWASNPSTDWTVIYDPSPAFSISCLNRVAFVKPLPDDLSAQLEPISPHLSTIGIWPPTCQNFQIASQTGASRICRLGKMQSPPFTWHQDGAPTLLPLVKWQDIEQ